MTGAGAVRGAADRASAGAGDSGSSRGRLLEGLAASIRERGYSETKVSDIVRHARTSRRTFYEEFPTKDACFVELVQATTRVIRDRIAKAVDPAAPWEVQIRQAVEAYIDTVAAEPEIALSWTREMYALGAETARRLQREAMESLIGLLQELGNTERLRSSGMVPVTRSLAVVILGGLRELTATVVEDGGDVRDITEDAVDAALALFGPRIRL